MIGNAGVRIGANFGKALAVSGVALDSLLAFAHYTTTSSLSSSNLPLNLLQNDWFGLFAFDNLIDWLLTYCFSRR